MADPSSLLDGVIFSGYDSGKHPRDAHGHFMELTDGPDDLKVMLQEINDPVTRQVAADRMEDLGRSQEAQMLRQPEHPLVAIGGGVFYAPGIRAHESDPRTITVRQDHLTSDVPPRLYHHFRMNGETHRVKGSSFSLKKFDQARKRGDDARSWEVGKGADSVLAKIYRHQMTAGRGEHLALSPREHRMLANLHQDNVRLDQTAPDLRGWHVELAGRTDHDSGYPLSREYHATHGVPPPAMMAEIRRRRRHPAGLSMSDADAEHLWGYPQEEHTLWPRMLDAGWIHHQSSYLAPSARHLEFFRTHGHPWRMNQP